jgi:hypothetical protein
MASASPVSTSASQPSDRRRQRSVRVTVAIVLLTLATVVVLGAVLAQASPWSSIAAVLAVLCGWAAVRIVHVELVQSRVEAATDRAALAQAYLGVYAERVAEHADFSSAMTERLSRRDRQVSDLEASFRTAVKRAVSAEGRLGREARRVVEAQAKVLVLSARVAELEIARAEGADELATWHSEGAPAADRDTVVDLIAWEERVAAGTAVSPSAQKRA